MILTPYVTYRYTHILYVTYRYTHILYVTYRYTHILYVTYRYTHILYVTYRYTHILYVTYKYTRTIYYIQIHTYDIHSYVSVFNGARVLQRVVCVSVCYVWRRVWTCEHRNWRQSVAVSLCVYLYTYVYIYIYIHMYMYIYIYIHISSPMCGVWICLEGRVLNGVEYEDATSTESYAKVLQWVCVCINM